jgi:enoyl-CoA hydratase
VAVGLPDEIQVASDGPLRVVTLNRPEQLNATNAALHRGIAEVWRHLAADPDAKVVILTGAGTAFSAGGDFGFMLQLQQDAAFREQTMAEARTILLDMLRFPLPVIAAVNGPAVGLGASLALSCDLVLLSDRAHLADPHLLVGLVAGDGGAALWPLYTSLLRAKEFIFTGERIAPELAVQLGLANRVVPHDELLPEATKLAQKLARLPQKALRDTKRALNTHAEKAVAGPLEIAIQAEIASMASPEHAERVKKLISKSKNG